MEIIWSEEDELRGTGGALKLVEGLIDDTLLLANADIMIELDAAEMLRAHLNSSARATLALHPAQDGEDYGVVRRDVDGWVKDIVGGVAKLETGYERAAAEHTNLSPSSKGSPCYFRGVHMLEPAVIAALPDDLFSCVVRQGYIPQLAAGAKVHGYMCKGAWADAGTPQRLMEAHELFWRADAPVVERGAYIGLKTELHGKTHVAAGANVGHSCQLTDVLVQPDAVVAPRTVLKRAIVYGRRGQAWTFDTPT
jgi:NDP-sugar pyrophosphorylase family protein